MNLYSKHGYVLIESGYQLVFQVEYLSWNKVCAVTWLVCLCVLSLLWHLCMFRIHRSVCWDWCNSVCLVPIVRIITLWTSLSNCLVDVFRPKRSKFDKFQKFNDDEIRNCSVFFIIFKRKIFDVMITCVYVRLCFIVVFLLSVI